jgi:hypothetical protein
MMIAIGIKYINKYAEKKYKTQKGIFVFQEQRAEGKRASRETSQDQKSH